jgi:hypothetical protein
MKKAISRVCLLPAIAASQSFFGQAGKSFLDGIFNASPGNGKENIKR